MILKDDTDYIDGKGREIHVVARSKDYAEYVWARSGDWYERATGKRVRYGKRDGEWCHFVGDFDSPDDLIQKAGAT